nr:hypothetical protein [Tanacetum cinerariifolium]
PVIPVVDIHIGSDAVPTASPIVATATVVPNKEKSPEEKVKEMMQLVPIEEVYVQALQVKHPIIDLKVLVKEYLSIRPALSDKKMELWVELKRLYEPDLKDQLWAQTQNYMHAPSATCDWQRQEDLHASREGLSFEEGSSPCDDLL